MTYSENVINILSTQTYKGIGNSWIVKNLKGNEPEETIIYLLNRESKIDHTVTIDEFRNVKQKIERDISRLNEFADGAVALGDSKFPPYRGNVKSSEQPIVIFYKGNLDLLAANNKNIAVIGLLTPDNDIEVMEREVVAELVKNGATIISGLALGCDSIAHRETLHSKGKTVAILPSPLNNILPAKNRELAEEIVNNNGLLITEYYLEHKSGMELNSRYQDRDRLQALYSDGIVLSASYAKSDKGCDSGSRLAMQYASNYSIPRAVIYEDSLENNNNRMFNLNRQLINEDKEVIKISRGNLVESIMKILSKKPVTSNTLPHQTNLFG